MHVSARLLTLNLGLFSSLDSARAEEPVAPATTAVEAETETEDVMAAYEARLAEAIQAYQRGNRELATAMLSELAADPAVQNTELQLQAKIYLGEVYFVLGKDQLARMLFEQVILSNPRHVLDPFRHPPDVAAFFNQVKLTMDLTEFEPPPPLPIRPPGSAWSPLAVYHFRHDRNQRAWIYAGSQAAAGTASVLLASMLLGQHDWDMGGIPYDEGDEDALRSIQQLQTANLICFLAFYGSWGASVFDAHRDWQQRRMAVPQGANQAPGLQITLNGSW